MMKLSYNRKRVITTADLYDATDPPLTFEVRTKHPRGWGLLYEGFDEEGGNNPEKARELIAMVFLSVSDGENTYPLDNKEQAKALQEAIEESNPGAGEEFICNLAWAYGRNYFLYLSELRGNSLKPSKP